MIRVAINGFGRIGRLALRLMDQDSDIDVAIVVPKSSISKDIIEDMSKLFKLRRNISTDIEPILLIDGEDTSGFLDDILEYGEIVYSR